VKGKGFIESEVCLGICESCPGCKDYGRGQFKGGQGTDLAPSHFSFSGLEPDEKRDILYPLWELVFSDWVKVERR